MRFKITYVTQSGQRNTVTIQAESPNAACGQAAMLEREIIVQFLEVKEVK